MVVSESSTACCRRLWIGLFIAVFSTLFASAASPKRVLILNPFDRDVEPFSSVISELRSTLARELGQPVDIYEIPLTLGRFTGSEGDAPLVAFLAERIRSHPVDLVVPVGALGVQFAARNREILFADIPILAVAAEPRLVPPEFLENNATIVTQRTNLPGMVEDILQMQPETANIAVVFGSSQLDKIWLEQCRREFEKFNGRVEFTWMTDLTMEQMIEKCSNLPPRSFILHGFFLVDAAGIASEKSEALRKLHETANAPVFAAFTSELGMGAIGGRLFQNSELGVEGARVAVRILRGEKADQIPPVILESVTPVYDWRELRRWKIPEANLPSGSIIKFRQPSFWERYRWQTIGVVLFGIFQAFLIVGLWVNRNRRIRSENEARLIAEISSKFINLPASDIDREILDAERRVCELFGLDVAILWQWSNHGTSNLRLTHLHGETKVRPPDSMNADVRFPWFRQAMIDGRVVGFSSFKDLPEEAARDVESFRTFGIRSCLSIPLMVGGETPIGALSLNTTRGECKWRRGQIAALQMVAQVFTNALARQRADHALSESEMRLTLAADAAGAGLWVLDWERQVFWITDRARTIFGHPPDVVFDMAKFEQSVHPEDLDAIRKVITHSVTTGEPLHIEYRILRGDGETRWIASNGRMLFKANGEPERLLGLSMDITERKQAEQRVNQLSFTVEQSPTLVLMTDLGGRIVYVNRKFTEVTGYTLAECLGRKPSMLKSGESPASAYRELWSTITAGNTWHGEFHNRRKNGELYWERAVISPLLDSSGKVTHYVGVKEDITDAKLSETALRASEKLNRLTFEQASVGIAHVGIDGRWLRVNDRLCQIVGYPREELTHRTILEITHPDDRERYDENMRRLLAGEISSFVVEKRYLRSDETTVWTNHNASLVMTDEGVPVLLVIVLADITEQRNAEMEALELRSALAHSGRVSLLGQLASALAHELSQPLGAILRNAEAAEIMLQDDSPDIQEMRSIIEDILRDDHRAGQVIDKLRSLLKKGALDLKPIDLNEIISEVITLVRGDARTRHVQIHFTGSERLPLVGGDRIHLQQVLINLLVNAMDALEANPAPNRSIRIEASQTAGAWVEIRVCDNGPGITAEQMDKLFAPFFTTKSNGMGLGLPVSRTIIDAHKGKLRAENLAEGGACFIIELPAIV